MVVRLRRRRRAAMTIGAGPGQGVMMSAGRITAPITARAAGRMAVRLSSVQGGASIVATSAARTMVGSAVVSAATGAVESLLALAEDLAPQGVDGDDAGIDLVARDRCLGRRRQAPGVLQAPVFTVGVAGG